MGEDSATLSRPSVSDEIGRMWPIHGLEDAALTLTDNERNHLADVARGIAAQHALRPSGHHLDDSALMVDCSLTMYREAPVELLRALLEFRHQGNVEGALLIRNLPTDEKLPSTPGTGNYDDTWRNVEIASVVQLMVMNVLGDVISYADEKQGRIIQDVVPVRGSENKQENSGTCLLELHTEDGFHPAAPRFISLLGLRADHDRQAWTLASGIRKALAGLDGGTRAALSKPTFRIKLASSFVGDATVLTESMAVLRGSALDPELCVDFHAMVAADREGQRALANLQQALLSNLHGHVLDRGDLIIIDNDKAVHGRTTFTARADNEDRWLRRCFAVPDLRRSSAARMPNSRVHAPLEVEAAIRRRGSAAPSEWMESAAEGNQQ